MIDPAPPQSALIRALEHRHSRALSVDTTDLALLRRTLPHLPEHPDPRAIALVAGYCGASRQSQDAALLAACLWATHHHVTAPRQSGWNLGRALRTAPGTQGERMWDRLCTASETTLPRVLAEALALLDLHDAPTDWHRLHRDLRSWHQGSRDAVLRRWCTGLFGPLRDGSPLASPSSSPSGPAESSPSGPAVLPSLRPREVS